MESTGKMLVLVGAFIILFGLLFIFWSKIPFLGKLPGDITVQKGGITFFFPLVSSLVLSLLLTVILNLVFRLFK